MQQINLKTLKSLLPHYYDLRQSLYLWGKPSSGKTAIIRQFAKEMAANLKLQYSEDDFGKEIFTLKIIPLSQFDAPDIRGMPELIGEGINRTTTFIAAKELPREGQGIIFFDELNLADDTVRAACYQFILEGRYGNLPCVYAMNEKGEIKTGKFDRPVEAFWRVAASNSEQDYCDVNKTSMALLRRFCHFQIEPDLDEIINYFLETGKDSRVIAYLKNCPEDLFPVKWDERLLDKKANPFPYTWEVSAMLMEGKKDLDTVNLLVASCVGPEVASRFSAYCKMTSKLDIDGFIKEPEKHSKEIEKDKERASLFYAVISNLASLWYKKDKRVTAPKTVEIAGFLPPEFSVAFLKMVLKKNTRLLMDVPGLDGLLQKLGVFFDEV